MDEGKPGWVQDQRTGLLEFTLCAHVRTQEGGGGTSPGPLCGKRRETESGVTGTEKEGRKEGEREKGERERGMEPPFVCWQSRRQRQ